MIVAGDAVTISLNVLTAGILLYSVVIIIGSILRNSGIVLNIGSKVVFIASLLVFTSSVLLGLEFIKKNITTVLSGLICESYPILIDSLSVVLLIVISLVSMAVALYTPRYMEEYSKLGRSGLFIALLSLFILSMILIVISENILWFLFMWEVMTFSSYLLIVWEYTEKHVIRAGWKYFTSMHFLSTLPLIIAVIATITWGGSLSIVVLEAKLKHLALNMLVILYALYLIGFASKAGIIPFHFWLPDAHPAAPSNVSALLSGVMIKIAVYGLLRFCCYILPLNVVIGYIVATLGALSLTIGTLYALKQTDAKRLLAYHSVGQMGYIWLGLGVGIVLLAGGNPLGVIGIVAGLYHLVNHAVFKALLFLSAGSVLYKTHTRDLNSLGGLSKIMPITSFLTLIAALSIAGVPPFNGFLSKWLIYESAFSSKDWLLIIYGIFALFISSATLASFIKFYTTIFTGELRFNVTKGEVPTSMLIGKSMLAICCIIWGVLPVTIIPFLASVPKLISMSAFIGVLHVSPFWVDIGISSYSPILLLSILAVLFIATSIISLRLKAIRVQPWDTGIGLAEDRTYYKLIAMHYYVNFEESIHFVYHTGSKLCNLAYNSIVGIVDILLRTNTWLSSMLCRVAKQMIYSIGKIVSNAREIYIDELIISPVVSVVKELARILGWSVLRTDLNTYLVYSALYVIALSLAVIIFITGLIIP